jgi:hypothetical protein
MAGTLFIGDINQRFWFFPIIGYRLQPKLRKSISLVIRLFCSYPLANEDLKLYTFDGIQGINFCPIGTSIGISF